MLHTKADFGDIFVPCCARKISVTRIYATCISINPHISSVPTINQHRREILNVLLNVLAFPAWTFALRLLWHCARFQLKAGAVRIKGAWFDYITAQSPFSFEIETNSNVPNGLHSTSLCLLYVKGNTGAYWSCNAHKQVSEETPEPVQSRPN